MERTKYITQQDGANLYANTIYFKKIIYLICMLKSNNTFLIVYGNGQFVKWKIFEKCGFLLEKQDKFDLQNICKIVEICLQKIKNKK
jgi:hypothetical protein